MSEVTAQVDRLKGFRLRLKAEGIQAEGQRLEIRTLQPEPLQPKSLQPVPAAFSLNT
jgi:hypothetical protein